MQSSFHALWAQVLQWTHSYGYHAVIPILAVDPAGVPWAWIVLLLIAEEARLSVPILLIYGFIVLSLLDHGFYAIGYFGGRPLVAKLGVRWPKIAHAMEASEEAMQGRGIWAVALGRYLPVIGRFVGTGAALAKVPYARFALFDALGVTLTVVGFGGAAHLIGRQVIGFPWFPQAVLAAYIASTILTALVTCWGGWRAARHKSRKTVEAGS
jgi:membrane protein DedA with SNARE-associated domain